MATVIAQVSINSSSFNLLQTMEGITIMQHKDANLGILVQVECKNEENYGALSRRFPACSKTSS